MQFLKTFAVLSAPLLALAAPRALQGSCFAGQASLQYPEEGDKISLIAAAHNPTGCFDFRYCAGHVANTTSISIQVVLGVPVAGGVVGPVLAEFKGPTDGNITYEGCVSIPSQYKGSGTNNFQILEVVETTWPNGEVERDLIRKFVEVQA